MSKSSRKVREQELGVYENKLHEANAKLKTAEKALKEVTAQSRNQIDTAMQSIQAEHQRAVNDLLRVHKEDLQKRDRKHDEDLQRTAEEVKRELEEKHGRVVEDLHRELAETRAARDQISHNAQKAKSDAESHVKATEERSKQDLVNQRRKFLDEAEKERSELRHSHIQELQASQERIGQLEAELEDLRLSMQALSNIPESLGQSAQNKAQDPQGQVTNPTRRVNPQISTAAETSQTDSQAAQGSGDSGKENVEPELRIRTFREITADLSYSLGGMFEDRRESLDLDDPHPTPTPGERILRDLSANNTLSGARAGLHSSSSLVQSQTLANPFTTYEKPGSKSKALPNSAYKREAAPQKATSTNKLFPAFTSAFDSVFIEEQLPFSRPGAIQDSQRSVLDSKVPSSQTSQKSQEINSGALTTTHLQASDESLTDVLNSLNTVHARVPAGPKVNFPNTDHIQA